jgi:hypothetical protein
MGVFIVLGFFAFCVAMTGWSLSMRTSDVCGECAFFCGRQRGGSCCAQTSHSAEIDDEACRAFVRIQNMDRVVKSRKGAK